MSFNVVHADKVPHLILRFINRLKQQGKSPHTLSAYRNDLVLFADFLANKGFHLQEVSSSVQPEWAHFLKENGRHSEASLRRAQMSVRSFLRYLVEDKQIERSVFLEEKSPKQPSHSLCTIQGKSYRELKRKLKIEALKGDEKAARDFCLILMFGELGLKASEATDLCWGDLSFQAGKKGSLSVRGAAARILKFSEEMSIALSLLRETRKALGLGVTKEDKLFFGYQNVSRRAVTPALHRHGVKFILYEVCSDILGIAYHSESLRSHAIVNWMESGIPSEKVAEYAGYSSLSSLERFTRGILKNDQRLPRRVHSKQPATIK